MSFDVSSSCARPPLQALLGPSSGPVGCLQAFDQSSVGSKQGSVLGVSGVASRCQLRFPSRSDLRWIKGGFSCPFVFTREAHGILHQAKFDLLVLVPSTNGQIVCQCRRSGGESSGRFEDWETGGFSDPMLNCKGDKKRPGSLENGRRDMESDIRDSPRLRPWNSNGDVLGSGLLQDCSESPKDRGWACSSSWSKGNARSACPPVSSSPLGEERKVGRSGFSGTDVTLLRQKASAAGMPMSLRILKQKKVQNRALRATHSVHAAAAANHKMLAMGESTCCSFKKAFSSMVFMIRTLQSHAIQLRQGVLYEDLQEVLAVVQREMHSSFLWLFQQVFACTPKLMLAVMLLLADYTVYSMGNHVALDQPPSPTPVGSVSLIGGSQALKNFSYVRQNSQVTFQNLDESSGDAPSPTLQVGIPVASSCCLSSQTESGAGGSGGFVISVSGNSDHPGWQSVSSPHSGTIFSHQDQNVSDNDSLRKTDRLGDVVKGHSRFTESSQPLILDHDTKKSLVAPVSSQLATDSYSCYDRTELIYQHAICSDSTNAMLLANFAQFLFLVRHDHDRAEQIFARAISADPADGDIIGRFANFLWLARGDRLAAEKAYRAVLDMDPTNPHFTGMYANFLWHSGEEESCCNV